MQWILLLTLLTQADDGFVAKARRPVVTVEQLQDKLEKTELELHKTKMALEDAKSEASYERGQTELARGQAHDLPPINITGFANVQTSKPDIFWRMTTTESCKPCNVWKRQIVADKTLSISDTAGSDIVIDEISVDEWTKRQWKLPYFELVINGNVTNAKDGGSITLEDLKQQLKASASIAKTANPTYGMRLGDSPVSKQQVQQFLHMMTPFLDGGTLTVTYTPRPGVIKEYLTISQGSVALRLPARTSFTVSCNERELAVKFAQPTVQVRIPVRGNTNVNSITATPDKIGIQLPWMIDPEFTNKDVPNSVKSFMIDDKPQMEVDEEADEESQVTTYGEPRSGHWPTVRKKYVQSHPKCIACGSTRKLNVHHIKPFHDNPELELDVNNLCTLCRDCHFDIGHDPDGPKGSRSPDWKLSNPNVLQDAAEHLRNVSILK